MGAVITQLLLTLGIFAVTALVMRALWRQMRKVNAHTAETRRAAMAREVETGEPAYEEWDEERGQYVPSTARVNPELIRQGAKASQSDGFLRP